MGVTGRGVFGEGTGMLEGLAGMRVGETRVLDVGPSSRIAEKLGRDTCISVSLRNLSHWILPEVRTTASLLLPSPMWSSSHMLCTCMHARVRVCGVRAKVYVVQGCGCAVADV